MKEWFFKIAINALKAMTLDYEACFLICLKNGRVPTSKNIMRIMKNNNLI